MSPRSKAELLERQRAVPDAIPVAADACVDLRGQPFPPRAADLRGRRPEEAVGGAGEGPPHVPQRRARPAAEYLRRRARLLEAKPGERAPVGEKPELQLLLALEHDGEQLERDGVERRQHEPELLEDGPVRPNEAHGVPSAEVRADGIPRDGQRVRQLLATSPVPRAARGRPADVGALREVVPDARVRLIVDPPSRRASAEAPVDLLVVREVRLVEQPDAAQRLGADEEAAPDRRVDGADGVEPFTGQRVHPAAPDDPEAEVDLEVRLLEDLRDVEAHDGARYGGGAPVAVQDPD